MYGNYEGLNHRIVGGHNMPNRLRKAYKLLPRDSRP